MQPSLGQVPLFITVAFVLFGLFFLLVLTVIVRSIVRSRKVLRYAGIDPMAAQAELAVRLAQGQLGIPARSLEQRLAELDDLHRRGVISAAEHSAARSAAVSELR
jgi:hypothetical protein